MVGLAKPQFGEVLHIYREAANLALAGGAGPEQEPRGHDPG